MNTNKYVNDDPEDIWIIPLIKSFFDVKTLRKLKSQIEKLV